VFENHASVNGRNKLKAIVFGQKMSVRLQKKKGTIEKFSIMNTIRVSPQAKPTNARLVAFETR
jgi:3-methyladenine DNA glycosylase Tag